MNESEYQNHMARVFMIIITHLLDTGSIRDKLLSAVQNGDLRKERFSVEIEDLHTGKHFP